MQLEVPSVLIVTTEPSAFVTVVEPSALVVALPVADEPLVSVAEVLVEKFVS